jgi:hypothetical protein
MLNVFRAVILIGVLIVSGVAQANSLGDLSVEGTLTLDAGSPLFEFTTLEVLPGASLMFSGLVASDTLVLRASEAIRIDGTIVLAPANSLQLEAPVIVVGMGAMLVAGEAGGGATIPASGLDPLRTPVPGNITGNDVFQIEPRGAITLQAPVPEADTWVMLAVGLVMVGVGVRRRGTVRV